MADFLVYSKVETAVRGAAVWVAPWAVGPTWQQEIPENREKKVTDKGEISRIPVFCGTLVKVFHFHTQFSNPFLLSSNMRFHAAFVACLVVLAAAGVMAGSPFTNCGTSSDKLSIQSMSVSPSPLVAGNAFSVNFQGQLSEDLTGGKVSVSVKFIGIPVFSKTYDLCELVAQGGQSCPVKAGGLSISKSENFPSQAPAGSYTGQVTVTDQSGAEVTCVKFALTIAKPSMNDHILNDEMIAHINSVQKSWVAHRSPRFEGVTRGEIRRMLRTRVNNQMPATPRVAAVSSDVSIPISFDARQQWASCITPVRDQQQCGSCWAFSSTGALSDRFCIASSGSVKPILSPQYVVSCDSTDYGCQGGYLQNVWEFLEGTGTTTDACVPYTSGSGVAPDCSTYTSCQDGSTWQLYQAKANSATNPTAISDIQTAIMTTGPVQAAFSVYQDFFSYKSGVYVHTSGSLDGGHAIVLVGWTVVNGMDAWIVRNSWGSGWGLSGYFMIQRGVDMCGIESQVWYGNASV